MLSGRFVSVLKDVLLVAGVFALLSGTYYGFAVAERYRALTQAYIAQSEALIQVLERTNGKSEAQPN